MLRICSLIVLLCANAAAADISGDIRVVDGDSLAIGKTAIRLHGIDAAEAKQLCGGGGEPRWACGAWVTGEVRARYEGRFATCTRVDTDRYGRMVATCTMDGEDIGRSLVQAGLAFAYRKYSMAYDLDEKAAAVNDRGLHAVGVTSPEAYRAAQRAGQVQMSDAAAPGDCAIKGNLSRSGTRIYHVPGQRDYAATRIATNKGERWFCSETEAQRAGWRRAKR